MVNSNQMTQLFGLTWRERERSRERGDSHSEGQVKTVALHAGATGICEGCGFAGPRPLVVLAAQGLGDRVSAGVVIQMNSCESRQKICDNYRR